jgi:predicted nucleotidyltransferase
MLSLLNIPKDSVLAIYNYGSRVYGTETNDSDYDYIIVVQNGIKIESQHQGLINYTIYSESSFKESLLNHEISCLECLFLPKKFISIDYHFDFKLDLHKLRNSISQKASNSWVKANKKMTIEKDKDIWSGKKSLFHSLRILNFGIQIATTGIITDYHAANHLWTEISEDGNQSWDHFSAKYKKIYNQLKSEFREICPKS